MSQRIFYVITLFTTTAVIFLVVNLLPVPTQAAIPHNDIEICTDVIRRGDFEGPLADVAGEWSLANGADFTTVAYSGDRAIFLPPQEPPTQRPAVTQTFTVPDSISSHTTAVLQFKMVANYEVSNSGQLSFGILSRYSTIMSSSLPNFDPNNNSPQNWQDYSLNIFGGYNPLLILSPGDEVEVGFYSDSYDTNFYIDDVSLVFCTPPLNAQDNGPTYLPIILKNDDGSNNNPPGQPGHSLSVSQSARYTQPELIENDLPLTYTIRYAVSGNETAPGLTLADTLPQSTTFRSCSGGLTCNESSGKVTWDLGDTLPDTTDVITLELDLDWQWFRHGTALRNNVVLTDTTGQMVTDTHTLPIPRDIVVLFDMSGSMQFDTAGYGFYEPFDDGSIAWYNIDKGLDYPNPNNIHRIPTDHLPTTNCGTNCGSDNVPYIQIYDNLGDFSEPQGSNFTIAVYNHQANTAYTAWFVHNTDPGHSYSLDFTTDNLGSRLLNFVISRSALPTPSGPEYKIYTTLRNNNMPMATCLGDLPINAPCFQVTENNFAIEARNITQGDQQQQPYDQAYWPISSSIPIYLFGHDVNTDYTIKFAGLTASAAPGELMFDGVPSDVIPTDSQFGTNRDSIPAYYLATSHSPGEMVISSENAGGSEMAATMVELVTASIDIAGEEPDRWHPADDVLWITLRDHAPLQQYEVVFEDGITPPTVVRANDQGGLAFNYVVPHSVQEPCANEPEPGCEPVPVNIHTLDYNRGSNPNEIAQRTILVFTPIDPYINVPGGAQWPAGSDITIQVRRHLPNANYLIFLQQGSADSPTFSQPITDAVATTDSYGTVDITYQLPITLDGYYAIRSFEESNLSQPTGEFDLRIINGSTPITTLDDQPGSLSLTDSSLQVSAIPGARNEGRLCWQRDGNIAEYFTISGAGDARRYVVIEAELYSANKSVLAGPFRMPGQSYWAVQHTNWRTVARMMENTWDPDSSFQVGATPILPTYSRGSFVSHHPFVTWAIDDMIPYGHSYTLDEVRANPNDVPSLEYDFITATDWEGTGDDDTRIWMRAQGGYYWWADGPANIYWAVYEYADLYGAANGNPANATPLGSGNIERADEQPNAGPGYGGADGNRWMWRQLTNGTTHLDLENGTRYTLKIWAGQSGYDIDQIVIGNQNDTTFTSNYNYGSTNLEATPGSAFREACNRCNPIYGLTVDQADCLPPNDNGASTVPEDNYDLSHPHNNPRYSGYQPLRGTKEGVKDFIRNLNPQYDQVGIVGYSTGTPSEARVELRCLNYNGSTCYSDSNPISYTEVLKVVEQVPPNGATNVAQAMLFGLEMLGVNADDKADYDPVLCQDNDDHCARVPSRRIMILINDSIPNFNPYDEGASSVNCYAIDYYQPNVNDYGSGRYSVDRAKDCVMHYGIIAANNDVTMYTIGLGDGVDARLLQLVAELRPDGKYFAAPSVADLEGIFDAILEDTQ